MIPAKISFLSGKGFAARAVSHYVSQLKMIVSDKNQIASAIADILSRKGFLTLSKDDFKALCPEPSAAIHVVGANATEASEKLRKEWAESGLKAPDAVILSICGKDMLMSDLEKIDAAVPECLHIKKGLEFSQPEGGNVELWLFIP